MQANWTNAGLTGNRTHYAIPQKFPLDYRIIATAIHVLVFIVGVFGNIAVVVVVRRTRSLHTPTYCYLVSLAMADLLVLMSAMPEAIASYHLYARQWVLGRAGCSLLIFGNFLGINASSTSILCFSVERYIGICKPLLAHKVCSLERAKKIIIGTWTFAVVYSSPWLGLTRTTSIVYRGPVVVERCEFRLEAITYSYFFLADLMLFYVLPLIASIALYVRIGLSLRRSQLPATKPPPVNTTTPLRTSVNGCPNGESQLLRRHTFRGTSDHDNQIVQVVRMLLTIVILFAVLWLPYRGLLVYNSLSSRPWLNIWYLLFAKTAIFINSAINPLMYNVMSRRFRRAFVRHIFPCFYVPGTDPSELTWTKSVPALTYSTSNFFTTPRGSMSVLNGHRASIASQRSMDGSCSLSLSDRQSMLGSMYGSRRTSLTSNQISSRRRETANNFLMPEPYSITPR